ncbi:hypothetical protein BG004_002497 [Podila humilis]|nr:hypothetical protein BG004_002497 [Podila humilis]
MPAKLQLSALLLGVCALFSGVQAGYIYDNLGDIVGTGRNYKLKCNQGTLRLALNSDTWEYVNTASGPDLVVKFCTPNDCSRGSPVYASQPYHLYTQRPRGPGYAVIAYNEIGSDWWVATRSAGAASEIKVEETGSGNKDKYHIQQAGYWWTQENKSIYLTLRSKNIGEMTTCSFVYAGEDFGFRGYRGLRESSSGPEGLLIQ